MRHYTIQSERLTGLHNSGLSFSFEHPLPSSPFFIGFRYDTSFSHYPLYRIFRDSSGLLLADHNSVVDTAYHLVYVKTTRLDYPFLLLADTIKPTISFLSDTSKTIGSSDLDIQFKVKDNIANCRWQVFSNSGNEPPLSVTCPRDQIRM